MNWKPWNYPWILGNVNNEGQLEDFINADNHTAVSDFPDDDNILQSVCKPTVQTEEDDFKTIR